MKNKVVSGSVKEIIDKYAPEKKGEVVLIHKDDGTKCWAGGGCRREHEIYFIDYNRTSIWRGPDWREHLDCPYVEWGLKCSHLRTECEKCGVKNRVHHVRL